MESDKPESSIQSARECAQGCRCGGLYFAVSGRLLRMRHEDRNGKYVQHHDEYRLCAADGRQERRGDGHVHLSTHVAVMDSRKRRDLTGGAILYHAIGSRRYA